MTGLLSCVVAWLADIWHGVPLTEDIHEHVLSPDELRKARQREEDIEAFGVPAEVEAVHRARRRGVERGIGDVPRWIYARALGHEREMGE